MKILRFDSLPSTNDYAKELARNGADDWTVVVAGVQTAGRGQGGHSWLSLSGGLYMSVIVPFDEPHRLTMAAGVAAAELFGSIRIKWVNDLMMSGKKMGGILTEGVGNKAVVGFGVNVDIFDDYYPEELNATSLMSQTGYTWGPELLPESIIERFKGLLEGDFAEVLRRYRERCDSVGKAVTLTDTGETGLVIGIDDDGALVVEIAAVGAPTAVEKRDETRPSVSRVARLRSSSCLRFSS